MAYSLRRSPIPRRPEPEHSHQHRQSPPRLFIPIHHRLRNRIHPECPNEIHRTPPVRQSP